MLLNTRNSLAEPKDCVLHNLLNTAVNSASSVMSLYGNNESLWQDVVYFCASMLHAYFSVYSSVIGLWRWSSFLKLKLCTAEFVCNFYWLLTTKLINENMYSHGTGKIAGLLNRHLHEFLDFTNTSNKFQVVATLYTK